MPDQTETEQKRIRRLIRELPTDSYETAWNAIQAAGPEAYTFLAEELARLSRRKRRLQKLRTFLAVLFAVTFLGGFYGDTKYWMILQWTVFAVGWLAAASPYQKSLVAALKRLGDISAVGPLAQALWVEKIDQQIVTDALSRLLPQMRPSDAHLLTPEHRTALYSALKLKPEAHADFLIVLLKALEQIGDEGAIPYVQRLIDQPAKSEKARRVSEAAKECLPALQEVAARRKQESTLLRPASPGDDLLRPALGGSIEPAEQLLRPAAE